MCVCVGLVVLPSYSWGRLCIALTRAVGRQLPQKGCSPVPLTHRVVCLFCLAEAAGGGGGEHEQGAHCCIRGSFLSDSGSQGTATSSFSLPASTEIWEGTTGIFVDCVAVPMPPGPSSKAQMVYLGRTAPSMSCRFYSHPTPF